MPASDIQIFRSNLGDLIGRDIVYVTAADSERHFDPITFLHAYAGQLFLTFSGAAGAALTAKFHKSAVKFGKKAAETSWQQIAGLLSNFASSREKGDKKQLTRMKQVDRVVQEIGAQLADNYFSEFVAAGRKAIEKQLRSDHFPDAKAKRISTAIARDIEARIARPRAKKSAR
jgi:hypothetical protein